MNRKDQINYEASRDPETLEREIDQQRAEIGSTLSALEQKFSPGELFDKALGFARGNGSEFAHNLGSAVKSHPVSTILLGVGALGLMLGERRQPDYGGYDAYAYDDGFSPYGTSGHASSDGSSLGAKTSQLKEKAQHLGTSISDSARHRRHQLDASGRQLASSARSQAYRAQHAFSRLADEQPLALGAIGIGIGALLGALLPPTQREDQMLGATADRLKSDATDMARREMATLQQQGEEAGRRIRDDMQASASQHRDATSASPSDADVDYPGMPHANGGRAPADPARGMPPTPLV
ncbi:MAG: DUF3618 domain-containing protein [Spongiibacteraceae bacterium]|jgi:ElaB/YqjD/DUF883 family membrane-anchored ribosome-binding protein|nr:DUF3618 domain-containing protein [Spongiibacteraceae bacterium]